MLKFLRWTISCCVILRHQLSSKGFTADTCWLQGQDALFLSSPAPESHFYSPVDKIRTPVWGWLLWNATHPSSACPSDVCTQHEHLCVRECVYAFVVTIVLHTYHRVQKHWFILTSRPSADCSLHVSVCQRVIGVGSSIFSWVVNWCHCYPFMLTDSCLDQMETEHIWCMKIYTSFMVRHHFCYGSQSLPVSPPCCWKRQICCDDTARLCISSFPQYVRLVRLHAWWSASVTSLLDSNTESLINPVFILVNLARPPTCQPATGWRLLLLFTAQNISKHVFPNWQDLQSSCFLHFSRLCLVWKQ